MWLLVFALCCALVGGRAQDVENTAPEAAGAESVTPHQFDRDNWRKTIEGIDYTELVEKNAQKPPTQKEQSSAIDPDTASALAKFLQIFMIIAGAALISFILYKILGGANISRKKDQKISTADLSLELEKMEENLPDTNPESLIQQAIIQKNYALAIRLYYLAILKNHATRERLFWKKNKTNYDYLRELNGTAFAEPFSQATLVFERVWYGDKLLEASDFQSVRPLMERWMRESF